jgi:hypothetical protein
MADIQAMEARAGMGSMKKVKGISKEAASVAVKPGTAPTKRP